MGWFQLTPLQAQSVYGVPPDIAGATENTFFGMVGMPITLYNADVPRPLLAFLGNRERLDVVTLHIQTIEPETWEYRGMLPNPLEVEGGLLSLGKEGLAGLVAILSSYRERLSPAAAKNRQMFKQIDDSKAADFRLHPEWFPGLREEYYIQTYDPLAKPEDALLVTILIMSAEHVISWKVAQFPLQALQEPSFNPLDHALPRVNLDRTGMQELASLLQAQSDHLEH